MSGGICLAYDGALGAGMGDYCIYDACTPQMCVRKRVEAGVRDDEPNPQAVQYRIEIAERAHERDF